MKEWPTYLRELHERAIEQSAILRLRVCRTCGRLRVVGSVPTNVFEALGQGLLSVEMERPNECCWLFNNTAATNCTITFYQDENGEWTSKTAMSPSSSSRVTEAVVEALARDVEKGAYL